MADIDINGLIMVIVLYITTLFFGLWAKWKRDEAIQSYAADAERYSCQSTAILKKPNVKYQEGMGANNISDVEEEVMLAGRHLGWIVGSCTMTATWVGGGYVVYTSEMVYNRNGRDDRGLLWTVQPWASSIGLIFGGFVFAKVMRDRGYVTMLDPVQERFGRIMGVLLYIPYFVVSVATSAISIATIGKVLAAMLHIPKESGAIISAILAVTYTVFGGLYSVSFTDILQLISIFFGLWLCLPFVLTNDHVDSIIDTWDLWKGTCELNQVGLWIEFALKTIAVSVVWQPYFQRVLASKTPETAMLISFISAGASLIASIPLVLFGAAARSVKDWTVVENQKGLIRDVHKHQLILPLVLTSFTPITVGWIGLGAVCAAVMSTLDSIFLGFGSMFTRNIYKQTFKPTASNKELYIAIKVSVVSMATISTVVPVNSDHPVFKLFILCSDLVYVVFFPIFVGSLFMPYSNAYGSLVSFVVGLFFRLAGGFWLLPPLIKYPGYSEELGNDSSPFRTFSMLMCLASLAIASRLSEKMFRCLPANYDVWKCFTNKSSETKIEKGTVSTEETQSIVCTATTN